LYLKAHVPFNSKILQAPEVVADTLLECIKTGDLKAFRRV
jgi:hypothetical protein